MERLCASRNYAMLCFIQRDSRERESPRSIPIARLDRRAYVDATRRPSRLPPERAGCIYVDLHSGKRYEPSPGPTISIPRVNLQTKYHSNFCRGATAACCCISPKPWRRRRWRRDRIANAGNERGDFADYRPFRETRRI